MRRARQSDTSRSLHRRGVSLVENAIVLNLFLLFLFGTFDMGRMVMMQQMVVVAAQQGARLAAVNTSSMSTANVQSYVTGLLAGQTPANLNIQVYQADVLTGANTGVWTNASAGQPIAVTVTGTYVSMVPGLTFLTGNIPLAATAIVGSEAN